MTDLRCTYCGGPLSINCEYVGPAYMSENTPVAIECNNWDCGAEWDPDGDLRTPGRTLAGGAT